MSQSLIPHLQSQNLATLSPCHSRILGRRLADGLRHWNARPTTSAMPSEVKLPPSLGSTSSFELKRASI